MTQSRVIDPHPPVVPAFVSPPLEVDVSPESVLYEPATGSVDNEVRPRHPRHRAGPRRAVSVPRRILGTVATILTVFGVLVALLAAYLFGFTALQQTRAQQRLVPGLNGKAGLTALSGRIPPEGHAVAILQIPSLHLRQVVVAGTSAQDLASGPGLMPGSAPPGVRGNTVIAGRRLFYGQPFAEIGSLRRGDEIHLTGGLGSFTYRVVSTRVVRPGQADPVVPTADPRLTLITSDGSLTPTNRKVVVAGMVSKPADINVAPIGVPPASQLALSGDRGALWPTILWAIALLFGTFGSIVLYRRWRQPWPTYLMTTPVLLALAVLCFQSLGHLLPATM